MRASKNICIRSVRNGANHEALMAEINRLRQRVSAIESERGFMDPEVQDLYSRIAALSKKL